MTFKKASRKQSECAVPPERDFAAARRFLDLAVGSRYLFFKRLLSTRYIPIQDIAWCYKRVEEQTAGCCCRITIFSRFLILVDKDGRRMKIPLDDDLMIAEVMDALKAANPAMQQGYSRERDAGKPEMLPSLSQARAMTETGSA